MRSQSVWHGLAAAMRPDDEPVLSFVQPAEPYVCLGYHRDIAEVDTEYCAEQRLPVLRRMVGGGPVYLDDRQFFFQITLPASAVPGRRSSALATLLAPAVTALQSLGIPAALDEFGEITVGEAKVCGHGAGQVREGVTVVGNLITGFDHARATRILRLSDELRGEVLSLMQSYVVATPSTPTPGRTPWCASTPGTRPGDRDLDAAARGGGRHRRVRRDPGRPGVRGRLPSAAQAGPHDQGPRRGLGARVRPGGPARRGHGRRGRGAQRDR